MGYYIHYGEKTYRTEIPKQEARKGFGVLWCLIAVFVGLYLLLAAEVRVMPGNPVVTRNAASNMVSELRKGESLAEAFKEFCLEIIENDESKSAY